MRSIFVVKNNSEEIDDIIGRLDLKDGVADEIAEIFAHGLNIVISGTVSNENGGYVLQSVSLFNECES